MSLLRSIWPSKPAIPVFPDDTIYPVHLLDNLKLFDSFLMTTTWFYNDVLDASKLHNSLTHLLSTGDWKKLGGRYRRPDGRTLQLHVPEKFTDERPAVAYSHEAFGMKIREHPTCSGLHTATERGVVHPQLKLKELGHKPRAPRTMLELMKGDHPALSLRVVTFEDATLVTLTWPHAMMDASGLGALVKAWSSVLGGPDAPVPPLAGARDDVMLEPALSKEAYVENSEVANKRLNRFGTFIFIFRLILGLIWGPRNREGVLHISKKAAEALRTQALSELLDDSDRKGEKAWISEHDALAALLIKSIALSASRPTSVTLRLPFDLRKRLLGSVDPGAAYVQNIVLAACCTVSETVAAGPLGKIALAVRQTLQRQTSRAQILASLRSKVEDRDAKYDSMEFPGPLSSTLLSITDWSKAGLFQNPDLSAAVVRQGERNDAEESPVGLPYYFQADMVHNNGDAANLLMNMVVHLGKDENDGHWFMATIPPRAWKLVTEVVDGYS
jgi:hypothetical protein